MKKFLTVLSAVIITANVIVPQQASTQAPEKMSYQAIVRDRSNNLLASASIGMQISILQNSANGAPVYIERHFPNTNANGLVTLEIGTGVVISGNFVSIDWANGPYFIKTETDPAGKTSYSITSTSQLLSVPYALYAKHSYLGGFNVIKLHAADELNLVMSSSVGPNVPGSSANIGDISEYKGLILEWRMNDSYTVFHQIIYLSEHDKDIILGKIATPSDYPRRYTTILADEFVRMMWLGVSLQGTQLYLSTNSHANPALKLQRIFAIL